MDNSPTIQTRPHGTYLLGLVCSNQHINKYVVNRIIICFLSKKFLNCVIITENEVNMNLNIVNNNYQITELTDNKKSEVYLYGAGGGPSSYDKISLAALKHFGVNISGFIDDDRKKIGTFHLEYYVYSIDSISISNDVVIIFSSNYFESIFHNIKNKYKNNFMKLKLFTSTSLLRCCNEDVFLNIMDFNEVQRRIHMHNSKFMRII